MKFEIPMLNSEILSMSIFEIKRWYDKGKIIIHDFDINNKEQSIIYNILQNYPICVYVIKNIIKKPKIEVFFNDTPYNWSSNDEVTILFDNINRCPYISTIINFLNDNVQLNNETYSVLCKKYDNFQRLFEEKRINLILLPYCTENKDLIYDFFSKIDNEFSDKLDDIVTKYFLNSK